MHTLLFLAAATASASEIPVQNQTKPALETLDTYDPQPLIKGLNGEGGDPNSLFFPADAFQQVKGIADPAAYYKQLIKWFEADVVREQARLKPKGPWTVASFKMGSCKWKEKGTEANALPYWSCYRSLVTLKNAAGEKETVPIKALINWGTHWYITHLGAIPKS